MPTVHVHPLYVYKEEGCLSMTQGVVRVSTKRRSLGVGQNPIRHVAYAELRQLFTGSQYPSLTKLKILMISSQGEEASLTASEYSAALMSAAKRLSKDIDNAILDNHIRGLYDRVFPPEPSS